MTDTPDDRISAALRTINFEVAAIKAAATERVERAEAELARLREPVAIGRHIRFSPAEDGIGNAVVCPDEPADGCYWTLIGSGPNADQNRMAQAICDALNARLREPAGDELPDDLRAPLHSLQADREYLVARIRTADNEEAGLLSESIRNRLSQIEEAAYRLNGRLRAAAGDVGGGDRLATDLIKTLATRVQEAEALLREAGEVMGRVDQFITNGIELGFIRMPDADVPDPAHEVPEIVRAFLSKLSPAPEPVCEDTYPDRVSMEPWPYSGHAPGRKTDADQ